MRRALVYLLLLAHVGCYGECFAKAGSGPTPLPSPVAIASPSPSPSASPTSTPVNPCGGPVEAVRVSGSTTVKIGDVLSFDVTPVSSAGPLEGALDYCNAHRFPTVERVSSNLRCVGSCGGWKPQFLALALGPFEVQIRVDGAVSPVFAGTVVQ